MSSKTPFHQLNQLRHKTIDPARADSRKRTTEFRVAVSPTLKVKSPVVGGHIDGLPCTVILNSLIHVIDRARTVPTPDPLRRAATRRRSPGSDCVLVISGAVKTQGHKAEKQVIASAGRSEIVNTPDSFRDPNSNPQNRANFGYVIFLTPAIFACFGRFGKTVRSINCNCSR